MAEFQEVMRQYGRMCKAMYGFFGKHKGNGLCPGCELDNYENCTSNYFGKIGRLDIFEEKVMNWAAEHPEPRMPTWREWILSRFPGATGFNVLPTMKLDYPGLMLYIASNGVVWYGPEITYSNSFDDLIPVDIAEKLSVKPIEEATP